MKIEKLFVLLVVMSFMLVGVYAASPSGATVTPGASSAAPEDGAGSDANALAGNVTEVTLFGYTNTQAWQGYYGNVTGTIQLANHNDNVMYNWSLANPEGEVYAANSSSVAWANIDCYDIATNGAALETFYNISSTDVDGVNETFAGNDHPLFYTNSIEQSQNECNSTKLYNDTGSGAFTEVLLTDNGVRPVFASIIVENGATGFDGGNRDFEMLVLEDGHGTDTSTTEYWFWVELE